MRRWVTMLLLVLGWGTAGWLGWLDDTAYAEIPVSQGKPVKASVTGAVYGPALAVDGLVQTAWRPTGVYPQYLRVDLGQSYGIQRIETLFERTDVSYRYKLETSEDEINWTLFADRSDNASPGFPRYADEGAGQGRFVRITILSAGAPGVKASLSEFSVYTQSSSGLTLLSQGRTAAADSEYGPGWEAAMAVDGDPSTKWAPEQGELPGSLVVDLGQNQSVRTVETTYDDRSGSYQYLIEFSTDAQQWYPYADRRDNREPSHPRYADSGHVMARYFRLTTTGMDSPSPYLAVAEFQVYGISSGPDPVPGGGGNGQAPSSVTLGQSALTLQAGEQYPLAVTAHFPPNDRTENVTASAAYQSSQPGVASVDASGLITAHEAGSAEITAAYRGRNAKLTVTVPAGARVQSISMDHDTYTMGYGDSQMMTVTAYYEDGDYEDITGLATYVSSSTSIVSVSSNGVLTAGSTAGTATVRASYGGRTDTATVTVRSSVYGGLYQISMSPSSFTLVAGGSNYFTLYAYGHQTTTVTASATYTSSNPSVASVGTNGYIWGLTPGSAVITASYGGYTTTASVTVTGTAADTSHPYFSYASELVTSNIGPTEVTLSWEAASDNVSVTQYRINRDGGLLTTLSGTSRSYTVTGLTAGQSYTFSVEAGDAAQLWSSELSAEVTTTAAPASGGSPAAPQPGSAPTPYSGVEPFADEGLPGEDMGAGLEVQAAVQMTSEVGPDGMIASRAVVDEASLTSALQSAGEGTVHVEIQDPQDPLEVEFPASPFAAGLGQGSGRVRVQLPAMTVQLPQALLSHAAAAGGGAPVTLRYSSADGAASSLAQELAARDGVQLLLPQPVELILRSGGQEFRDYQGMYVERRVSLEGAEPGQIPSAAWIRPESGEWGYLPSTVTQTAGQRQLAVKSPYGGMFTVKKGSRAFEDLTGHWAKGDVEALASRGLVAGVDAKRFAPDGVITRAQLSVLLVRAIGLEPGGADESAPQFRDVPPGEWYADAVSQAVKAGLIDGYEDGTFQPLREVTREQAAVLFTRAIRYVQPSQAVSGPGEERLMPFKDQQEIAPWARDSVAGALEKGFMQGADSGLLKPQAPTTRAEATSMLKRMLQFLNM